MHTMATSLLESRPMVGTVLYIGKGNLSPQRRTRAKWIPRLPCIPSGSKSVRSGVDNGYHVSLVPLLLHVRARFRTLPKCRRWGDKCGFLYREMRPNRYRGSHGGIHSDRASPLLPARRSRLGRATSTLWQTLVQFPNSPAGSSDSGWRSRSWTSIQPPNRWSRSCSRPRP